MNISGPDMENLLREIDKSYGTAYSLIWRDYVNRKKELPSIPYPKQFAEKFIETVMILQELYTAIDVLLSKEMISRNEYETAIKILNEEKEWLLELLTYKVSRF